MSEASMQVESDSGQILTVTCPLLRRGGRQRGRVPIARVVPARIRLVDWDALEAREKAGEKITPATVPYIDPDAKPKPATKSTTIFD